MEQQHAHQFHDHEESASSLADSTAQEVIPESNINSNSKTPSLPDIHPQSDDSIHPSPQSDSNPYPSLPSPLYRSGIAELIKKIANLPGNLPRSFEWFARWDRMLGRDSEFSGPSVPSAVASPLPEASNDDNDDDDSPPPMISFQANASKEFDSARSHLRRSFAISKSASTVEDFKNAKELLDKAMSCLVRATIGDDKNCEYFLFLGYTYLHDGKAAEAADCFATVLSLNRQVFSSINKREQEAAARAAATANQELPSQQNDAAPAAVVAAAASSSPVILTREQLRKLKENEKRRKILDSDDDENSYTDEDITDDEEDEKEEVQDLEQISVQLQQQQRTIQQQQQQEDLSQYRSEEDQQLHDYALFYFGEALIGLGHAMLDLDEFEEAVDYFSRALEQNEERPDALNGLGLSFNGLGDKENASKMFELALRLDPSYSKSWNNMGMILAEQKRYTEALDAFKQATTHYPRFHEAWQNISKVHYEQGDIFAYKQALNNAESCKSKASDRGCTAGVSQRCSVM